MIKIAKSSPEVKFLIVGSSDEESKSEVKILEQLSNVIVDDREVSDEEMEMYFKKAKAVLIPYQNATQSGVIVDAYKYSRPVIAYNVGAVKEQINDKVTGFLIKENNIEEFVEKIKLVDSFNDKELEKIQSDSYNFGFNLYSTQKNKDEFIKRFLQ